MLSLSLDTNCVLALDEVRHDPASHRAAEARAVRFLVEAHMERKADVALVAISASERQKNNGHLENFSTFQERLTSLGLGHLELLHPMLYFDVTFWDASLWSEEQMQTLERSIHEILFPNIPFLWSDYCVAEGLDPIAETSDRKWKNAKCDVQAFWSHVWRKRDVFVTSDDNFHKNLKKPQLIALAGGHIETPASAAALVGLSQSAV
jgi:hypothetical protein